MEIKTKESSGEIESTNMFDERLYLAVNDFGNEVFLFASHVGNTRCFYEIDGYSTRLISKSQGRKSEVIDTKYKIKYGVKILKATVGRR